MPKFHSMKYDTKLFKLSHYHKDIREVLMLGIIPYFWDSEVSFDLLVNIPPRGKNIDQYWDYEWELCDLEDKPIKPAIKDKVHVCNKGIRRKYRQWSSGKELAVKLGYLLPNKHYKLYVKLTNPIDGKDKKYLGATFTIKDRDEYYMQIFLILFSITMTLFFGFLMRGCGVGID